MMELISVLLTIFQASECQEWWEFAPKTCKENIKTKTIHAFHKVCEMRLKKSNTQRVAKRKCIIGDAQENAVQRWISQSWVRMCVFSSEEVTSGTYITCSILTCMWLTRVVGFCHLHGIQNFKPGVQKLLLLLVRTILVESHGQWIAFLWVQALCPVNCRALQVWILVSALWLSLEFLGFPRSCTWHLSAMQDYLTSAVRSSETQQHNWN